MEQEFQFDQDVEFINHSSVIDLKVSGTFYYRVRDMLIRKVSGNAEEIAEALAKLKDKEPENEEEFDLLTLLIFVHEFEKAAYEQKGVMKRRVQIKDGEATLGDIKTDL